MTKALEHDVMDSAGRVCEPQERGTGAGGGRAEGHLHRAGGRATATVIGDEVVPMGTCQRRAGKRRCTLETDRDAGGRLP